MKLDKNTTIEEIAELIKKGYTLTAEEPEVKKWEPLEYGDGWFVDGTGRVHRMGGFTSKATKNISMAGNSYPTQEIAKIGLMRRVRLERYNQLAMEENKRSGFVPNWGNSAQKKYFLYYNEIISKWTYGTTPHLSFPWLVYVNRESCMRMLGMLDRGEVVLDV